MKKILSILLLAILPFISKGQTPYGTPGTNPQGNVNQSTNFRGAVQTWIGFIDAVYSDTTSANASPQNIKNIPFCNIGTSDGRKWFRSSTLTHWVLVSTSDGANTLEQTLVAGNQANIEIKIFGILSTSQTTVDTGSITVGAWTIINGVSVQTNNVDIGNISNPAVLNLDNGAFQISTIRADSLTGNRLNQLPDSNGVFALSVNGTKADKYGNVIISTTGTQNLQSVTNNGNSTTTSIQAHSFTSFISGDSVDITMTPFGFGYRNLNTGNQASININNPTNSLNNINFPDSSGTVALLSNIPTQFNPIAGTNVTLTGTYPNITFNSSGGGGGSDSAIIPGFGISKSVSGTNITLQADTTNGKLFSSPYKNDSTGIIGDSYAVTSGQDIFPTQMVMRLGWDTTINAIAGTQIGGTAPNSFASRIDPFLAAHTGIVTLIIEGGSNDFASTTIGILDDPDSTTFYGGIWKIIRSVIADNQPIKLVFITPLRRGGDSSQFISQSAYVNAMLIECQRHGIQCVDEFNGSGITYQNMSQYSSDGIHPNTAAGRKRYCDVMQGGLVSNTMVFSNTFSDSNLVVGGLITAGTNIAIAGSGNRTSPLVISTTFAPGWTLSGNTVGSQPLLGTINSYPLEFIVDNSYAGSIAVSNGNTSLGLGSMPMSTTGTQNTTLGYGAGATISAGGANTIVGGSSGSAITSGGSNTIIGEGSVSSNNFSQITAIGANISNSSGVSDAVIIGQQASVSGGTSVAIGGNSTAANQSVAVGEYSVAPTEGVAIGFNALGQSSGADNVGIGRTAGYNNTTGHDNTFIGFSAGFGTTPSGLNDATCIGASSDVGESNALILGDTSTIRVGIGTTVPQYRLQIVGTMDADSVKNNAFTSGIASFNSVGTIVPASSVPLLYAHTIFTPTTGQTISLINNQYNIVNPAGALLALTVNLPSSPVNNDVVYIKFTQTISTVTYANGTVVDGITAPTAGGLTVLTYDSGTTSWY